jgi:hypothetical protein
MDRETKLRDLERLRAEVRRLESELDQEKSADWPPRGYYATYHILAGLVLGMAGAACSLLFNVVGSLLVGQHPLQLIRVYLTFPLGAQALETNSGLALAIGCCLYLGTGMILGVPFALVLSRYLSGASLRTRFAVVSLMALALWVFNFYVVLAPLQPWLFGGRWIVDLVPWWVAASTHLVFGWTMLVLQPLGTFVPYRAQVEAS